MNDDLISRRDTMKRLCEKCTGGDENRSCGEWKCIEYRIIEDMPSAVVRCNECKHWRNGHICMAWSRHGTIETKGDDFCSRAEPKEEKYTCSKCRWRFKIDCPKGNNSKDDDFCDFFVLKEEEKNG